MTMGDCFFILVLLLITLPIIKTIFDNIKWRRDFDQMIREMDKPRKMVIAFQNKASEKAWKKRELLAVKNKVAKDLLERGLTKERP